MTISPEQALFTAVRQACIQSGIDTYDYLPSNNASYPFAFVGEQTMNGVYNNKDKRLISLIQTVHIYHNDYRQRGTVTTLIKGIQSRLLSIKDVQGRKVSVTDDSMQMLSDNTTNTPLMHGVIEINYEIQ